jgi:hypothetical protein
MAKGDLGDTSAPSGDNGGMVYDDYKNAMQRLMNGQSAQGSPSYVMDSNIVKAGDQQFGKQFDDEYNQQQAPDPNAGGILNTAARIAAPVVMWPANAMATGVNAVLPITNWVATHTGGTASPQLQMPSTAVLHGSGVPDAPTPLQGGLETAATVLAGAAPAAVKAGLAYAPSAAIRLANVAQSLFKNAVAAPAASAAGGEIAARVGGEEWRPAGSLIGGAVPSTVAAPLIQRFAERSFVGPASNPNEYVSPDVKDIAAAEARQNMPPSYSRLANPQGQQIASNIGGGVATAGANRADLNRLNTIADQMVQQRQELPTPTPQTAQQIMQAAQIRDANAAAPSYGGPPQSAGAALIDQIKNQVGERTPMDITNTLQQGRQIAALDATGILNNRLDRLQARATPDAQGRLTVPYALGRGWRSILGENIGTEPGLSGPALAKMYPVITQDLENVAASRGVPPEAFRTADQIYHSEAAANDLRTSLDRTLGRSNATAGKNFAELAANAQRPGQEYTYDRLTGAGGPSINDVSPTFNDLALLSRQATMPTVQGGQRAALTSTLKKGAGPATGAVVSGIAHAAGLGPYLTMLPTVLGAAAGAAPYVKSSYLQSPGVRAAMITGQRTPYAQIPSIRDLIPALNAARIGAGQ